MYSSVQRSLFYPEEERGQKSTTRLLRAAQYITADFEGHVSIGNCCKSSLAVPFPEKIPSCEEKPPTYPISGMSEEFLPLIPYQMCPMSFLPLPEHNPKPFLPRPCQAQLGGMAGALAGKLRLLTLPATLPWPPSPQPAASAVHAQRHPLAPGCPAGSLCVYPCSFLCAWIALHS